MPDNQADGIDMDIFKEITLADETDDQERYQELQEKGVLNFEKSEDPRRLDFSPIEQKERH